MEKIMKEVSIDVEEDSTRKKGQSVCTFLFLDMQVC